MVEIGLKITLAFISIFKSVSIVEEEPELRLYKGSGVKASGEPSILVNMLLAQYIMTQKLKV